MIAAFAWGFGAAASLLLGGAFSLRFKISRKALLADTMIPEAFEFGGKQAGLATTLGFGLAFGPTVLG